MGQGSIIPLILFSSPKIRRHSAIRISSISVSITSINHRKAIFISILSIIPSNLRSKQITIMIFRTNRSKQNTPLRCIRQMEPIRTNPLQLIWKRTLFKYATFLRCISISIVRSKFYRINRGSPRIQTPHNFALLGIIFIAPIVVQKTRRLCTIRIVQILRHPCLVSNFHSFVNISIASINNRIILYTLIQISFFGNTPVKAAATTGFRITGRIRFHGAAARPFDTAALRKFFHECFEFGNFFAVVHTFDVLADSIEFAIGLSGCSPLRNFIFHFFIVPFAVFCKIVSKVFQTFCKRIYIFIALHHYAHSQERRIAIAFFKNVQVFEFRDTTCNIINIKCRMDFFLCLIFCIIKINHLIIHQFLHTFVFQVRKNVDVHFFSILEIGCHTKYQFAFSLFTCNFVEVIARNFKHGTRRGQINILDFKVTLVALDNAFKAFAGRFHCFAIHALHRHGRTFCKRAFLRESCHIQIRDNPRVFRSAASNFGIRTCRKNAQKKRKQKSKKLIQIHIFPFNNLSPTNNFTGSFVPQDDKASFVYRPGW